MLWLKIWLETRWQVAFMIVLGAIPLLGAATIRNAPTDVRALAVTSFVWIIVPIILAGSGIDTASGAPLDWTRGAEGSTPFTLSLPVTRSRLFAMRTIAGILETILLLALYLIVTSWLLLPSPGPSLADALRHLAAAGACSLAVYCLSACLSTFIQESWRIRASMLAIALLFVLASMRSLPPWADIFRPFVLQSPLLTHQMPWATIGVAVGLSALFLFGGLKIAQLRDY